MACFQGIKEYNNRLLNGNNFLLGTDWKRTSHDVMHAFSSMGGGGGTSL